MFVYSKVDDRDEIGMWRYVVSTVTSVKLLSVLVNQLVIYMLFPASSWAAGIGVVSMSLLTFEFDFR